ncbi:hypothetical protein C4587_00930 [Candidatus Parcubacteria bacterium]|nr:MAG: hypothetical protein C4587_00930 [Candidatus Parcubacteria bacterium]
MTDTSRPPIFPSEWLSHAEDDLCFKLAAATERAIKAERERDSLRAALDARWEADRKAARAIMRAEGREHGFPSVKDVVGFYIKQAEELNAKLEKAKRCYQHAPEEIER